MFEYNIIPNISFGFFSIESFRLIAYISALTAIMVASIRAKNNFEDLKDILFQAPIIIFLMVIGARFFYYLGPWTWHNDWTIAERIIQFINIGGTGIVLYGGFFGVIIGIIIYSIIKKNIFKKKVNVWKYFDIWSPACIISLAISRIGCFLGGCCYGIQTDVPWAIIRDGIPLHPTQIYSSINAVLIFGIVLFMEKKIPPKKRFQGFIFLSILMLYSTGRFIIEFMRHNTWFMLGLSASQWISIIVFSVSLYLFIIKWKKKP